MSVVTTPEERPPENGLQQKSVSIQDQQIGPAKKPSNVICFACKKKISAGEKHFHPFSN